TPRPPRSTLSPYTTLFRYPTDEQFPEDEESNGFGGGGRNSGRNGNPGLNSYRNMQSTLGSFYQDNNSETMELRRQLDEMKEKLADRKSTRLNSSHVKSRMP